MSTRHMENSNLKTNKLLSYSYKMEILSELGENRENILWLKMEKKDCRIFKLLILCVQILGKTTMGICTVLN